MTLQEIVAWASGVVFFLLLFGIAAYSVVTGKQIVGGALLLFRIIIAVTGAAFAAVIPGFLNVNMKLPTTVISAGGALAAFVILYFFNPPDRVSKAVVSPGPVQKRKVPTGAIEPDLPKRRKK